MTEPPISPHFGTAVTGERRFARPALEEEFDSVMTGTNGGTLFGLRRIGKSSEVLACAERLRGGKPPYLVLYQDAQGCGSESKLLVDILKQLPPQGWRQRVTQLIADDNAIASTARDALQKFAGKEADIQAYLSPIMDALESSIDRSEQVVLIIDEFPWLCRNILESDSAQGRSRVDLFLAAMRRWRAKGVRMLLLGSVGMAALGRRHGLDLSHLIDLTRLEVPPLGDDEARAFVRRLAAGGGVSGWTEQHTERLIEESAALYTSILQRGFQQLTVGGRAAPLEKISDIFAEKIRPNLDATFYEQFDRRLPFYRELPEPLPGLLTRLLQTVISSDEPVEYQSFRGNDPVDDADLGDALAMLREDGFLQMRAPRDQGQLWRPASTLVTAWWRQRRGGAFA